MPLGIRCSLNTSSPRTIVWPALLPPWKRTTACARSASMSVTLPLPSSPHWAPTTTIPGTTVSVGARWASRPSGARPAPHPLRGALRLPTLRAAAPADPGAVSVGDGDLPGAPAARRAVRPAGRGLQPPRVMAKRLAEGLGQRLLSRPQRDQPAGVLPRPRGQLRGGADRAPERLVAWPDALDVDAHAIVVPGDQRKRVAVGT